MRKGGPLEFTFEGETLEKKCFRTKVSMLKKNERGDPLVSPGFVCYAEKKQKTFYISVPFAK